MSTLRNDFQNASTQRAVWRNGGSNPAEIDVRTRTEVARRTFSESHRCAKPPPRCRQAARTSSRKYRLEKKEQSDSAVDKDRKR